MISKNSNSVREESDKKDESYGPWMIVEKKLRQRARDNSQKATGFHGKDKEVSRINGKNNRNFNKEITDGDFVAIRSLKGKEIINGKQHGHKSGVNPNDRADQPGRVVQPSLAATEIYSRTLTAEAASSTSIDRNSHKEPGKSSNPLLPTVISKGNEPKAVTMAVGHLDSDRHSAVTFLENKSVTSRKSVSPTNSPLVLPQEGVTDLGKKNKMKRTYNINKHSKHLHGSNTRFKNSGSRKVSLKKSIEQLAENITTFSKENLDSGVSTRTDNNLGGVSNPKQQEFNFKQNISFTEQFF
ncbi:hypothetical protein PVK06_022560 [Gossypium arboreum]|uniref:Uncharacterized protein n=1 Tax=Gossypium arboreum TaxID=29729 RepID=A0ABR0P8R1_GOSAR|nr:hypothetical protein PVK06_022560 [Gossypium arboreum]